jgi:ubiquinone/menaquinone biosynthesis C-methylase UbiE
VDEQEKNRGWSSEKYRKLNHFDGDQRDGWWNRDFVALMASRWRLEEVEIALDVGCGAGHWGQLLAPHLAPRGTMTGVDHESTFLEMAARRADSLGYTQRFEYRNASAHKLPFPDGTFDLVTCQTLLMHLPSPRDALGEMFRVSKKGGLLAVSEPNNLANTFVWTMAQPRMEIEDALRLVRLQHTLHLGKIALGHGDNSIGERVPGFFAALGLDDIRVYTNDCCQALFPPYELDGQQGVLDRIAEESETGSSGWGEREDVRRLFLAGGGDESEFDALFELELRALRDIRTNVRASRYASSGAMVQYLVSGRKP